VEHLQVRIRGALPDDRSIGRARIDEHVCAYACVCVASEGGC
jgi:hypothetical protein